MIRIIEDAFAAGHGLVRECGLDTHGTDAAVVVACHIFERDCKGKQADERFAMEAPLWARRVILQCYSLKGTI